MHTIVLYRFHAVYSLLLYVRRRSILFFLFSFSLFCFFFVVDISVDSMTHTTHCIEMPLTSIVRQSNSTHQASGHWSPLRTFDHFEPVAEFIFSYRESPDIRKNRQNYSRVMSFDQQWQQTMKNVMHFYLTISCPVFRFSSLLFTIEKCFRLAKMLCTTLYVIERCIKAMNRMVKKNIRSKKNAACSFP